MSKSNALENAWLDHYFLNAAVANVGDATGLPAAGTVGSLYWSLHLANPGEGGSQNTSPPSYAAYAYVAGARSAGGFVRTNNSISPAAIVSFPTCADDINELAYFWGLGRSSSGAGTLDYYGGIGPAPALFTNLASTDVISARGYTPVDGHTVCFWSNGFTLPSGVTEGTVYFVRDSSGSTFKVAATAGGAAIDLTTDAGGFIQRLQPITIVQGTTPRLGTATAIVEQ